MVSSTTYSRLLLCVIFVSLALVHDSTANAHAENGINRKSLEGDKTGEYDHALDAIVAGYDNGRKNLGVRKLEAKSAAAEHGEVHSNDSKAWVEAADELSNMMVKDYSGGPKARRKPPIHNDEPLD